MSKSKDDFPEYMYSNSDNLSEFIDQYQMDNEEHQYNLAFGYQNFYDNRHYLREDDFDLISPIGQQHIENDFNIGMNEEIEVYTSKSFQKASLDKKPVIKKYYLSNEITDNFTNKKREREAEISQKEISELNFKEDSEKEDKKILKKEPIFIITKINQNYKVHSRKAKDLIKNKIYVFYKDSKLFFINIALKCCEEEKDEFKIRKSEVDPTEKKKVFEILRSISKKEDLNSVGQIKFKDLFTQKISKKYTKVGTDQNQKNLEKFWERYFQAKKLSDSEITLKQRKVIALGNELDKLTLMKFYDKVFLKGENILGKEFEGPMKKLLTLNKKIELKLEALKNGNQVVDQGFSDPSYVSKFKKLAGLSEEE